MKVSYKGMSNDFTFRVVDISFDANEFEKVERIASVMKIKGWNIDIVTDEYAMCEVDNREEYSFFMQDWKECKRVITNCMKYGF